jgi:4-hydroxythreonine-4-phosphate dehydrogenase
MSKPPPPPLLISLGDPSGIGPEIVAKAFIQGHAPDALVVGDAQQLQATLKRLGSDMQVPVHHVPFKPPAAWRLGQVHAASGMAAYQALCEATHMVLRGQGRALVTAPLHKEALAAAGVEEPGHTEILQRLSGVPAVRMMLANSELKTVLVTVHMSLRRAIDAVTHEAVLQTIRITHTSLQAWGVAQPRIAVAGLNPHAGEGGLFGDEERLHIAPAIQQACREGIKASGPWAPDTIFMRARHAPDHPAEFDVVVAMTHDHGLIPVKYLGVAHGVNITLGLPFIRTSPDHGTAFDIAGQGHADPASLIAALQMARQLST